MADDSGPVERPNVVWVILEDCSPRLGCYGDDVARTPNLDALASEGARYDNACSVAGVCAPSRAAAMTGCYSTSIGTHHMRTSTHDVPGLPESYEAVPPHYVRGVSEYLRRAGYRCTLDAKTDYQFGEPFTMWDRHADDESLWDEPTRHWRDRADDRPFFAVYTLGITHESGLWDPADRHDQFGGAVSDVSTDPDAVDVPPYLVDDDATRGAIARYYDNIAGADERVGALLDALEADGLAEETVVMLFSDHGQGLPRCKRWPYEGGVHVPLIVRGPGVDPGARDRPVSLVDLAPTTLDLAGVDVPAHVEGQSFLAPDGSDAPEERDYVFAARDRHDEGYDMVRAARDRRYKYLRNYDTGPYVSWVPYRNRNPAMQSLLEREANGDLTDAQARWFADERPVEELYDLREDPHETENLADDPAHAETLARFRAAVDDWMARTGDRGHEDETTTRRRGWPDGQPETAAPNVIPNAPGRRGGYDPLEGETTLGAPARVRLQCTTQGASIGYALDADPDAGEGEWQLYAGPIDLPEGETTLRTKAVRYGYAESDVTAVTVTVEAE
jgi:arylsulfatase A-like enzyme